MRARARVGVRVWAGLEWREGRGASSPSTPGSLASGEPCAARASLRMRKAALSCCDQTWGGPRLAVRARDGDGYKGRNESGSGYRARVRVRARARVGLRVGVRVRSRPHRVGQVAAGLEHAERLDGR